MEIPKADLPTAATLRSHLALQEEVLKESLALMASELEAVQDDAELKRWLKAQTNMSRDTDHF